MALPSRSNLRANPRTPPVATRRSAPTPDDGATRTWLSVVRAYHHCSELMARRLAAVGVRTAEHEILANLRREPGLGQQALAARCFTAKSHISGLLTELEQRGWVRREPDPADARAKRLYLEPAGARVAERTAAVQAEVVALMTQGTPREELARVQAAMAAVSERLQQALAEPR
jgi:DNA-binding MarR family transcriptional regulator